MDFKKKRLTKALEDKTYRVKLVHSNKGWLTIGLTFITLFSASVLSAKTVDASAVNNVATANSTTSSYVQLYNSVTSQDMHKANRGLENGSQWKTAKAVKVIDGETYLLVGGNEYANANQMDLADETSTQNLTGIVHAGNGNGQYVRLYRNPLTESAQLVSNRALAKNTDWKTDQKVTVDGVTYYHVATDEWVKANDANLTSESSRSDKTYTKNAPDAENTTDNNNNSGNSSNGSHSGGGSTTPVKKTADVVVKYVDDKGNEIATAKTLKNQTVDSEVTEKAVTVDGYDLTSEATQKVTVSKDGNTITFTYKKTDTTIPVTDEGKVIVKYVDIESGKDLAPEESTSQKIGSSFLATARALDGYKVVGELTKNVTVTKEDITITFAYSKEDTATPTDPETDKANVIIKAVDEGGNAIEGVQDTVIADQEVGKEYTATAPAIEGYTATEATKTVKVDEKGSEVTFTYTKNAVAPKTATVTVNYLDADNNVLQTAKTDTADVDSTYKADAPEIPGYKLDGDASQSITVNADNNVINFKYTKNAEPVQQSTITTKYVDADGNDVADATSEKVDNGKAYTANAKEVSGYTVKGDATQSIDSVSGDKTITFTYTKNAEPVQQSTITTVYVDSEGNTIKDSATEKIDNGKSYTATAPEITGYTLSGDATQSIDSVTGDATLTFTYTKNAPVQTVDTSAVASKVISLVNDYRQQNGLSALNVDSNLSAGAVARATTEKGHVDATGDINSANHDEFINQSQPNLVQYGSSNMAENLAVTSGSTADEVAQNLFDQWKASAEHNATMLDASMTDIGVGVQQLANGQFVGIQDFGGKANTANWNADQFNSTTADVFGLTTDQIKDQLVSKYGIDLGTNYYVSDHIFKTQADYTKFVNSTFDTPSPLEGSIWGIGGTNGNAGTALIYDAKGNAVGWALYSADMDMGIDEAIADGLTTWIK